MDEIIFTESTVLGYRLAGGGAKAALLAGDLAGLLCGPGIMIFVYQNIGGRSVIDAIRYPLNED